MVEIRNDIFPKLASFFQPREATIRIWVGEAFKALDSLFKSETEFISYVNSLKTPSDAELLIRLSQFYLIAKKHEESPFVKLIMVISIIERLAARESEFSAFQDWIFTQDKRMQEYFEGSSGTDIERLRCVIELLKADYYSVFGSQRNVLDFFKRYCTIDDKVKLIESFKLKRTKVVDGYSIRIYKDTILDNISNIQELEKYNKRVEDNFMPLCYDWKHCYVAYGRCCPDMGCLLMEEDSLLELTLKNIVGTIYQMRSDFIHSAKIPPIGEEEVHVLGIINGKPAIVNLTTADLQNIFEKAFKNYFDHLLTQTI